MSDIAEEVRRLYEESGDPEKVNLNDLNSVVDAYDRVTRALPALLDRVEAADRVAREMHEFADGEAQEWRYVWRELEDWAAQLRGKEEE